MASSKKKKSKQYYYQTNMVYVETIIITMSNKKKGEITMTALKHLNVSVAIITVSHMLRVDREATM